MVATVKLPRGRSFKGLSAYMAEPKNGHERCLWTATENLAVDDPRTAAKIMAYTHAHADELKRAAGIKTTGRKATDGPVHHVMMSWPDAQQTTPEQQREAARDLLKTLGLERAQVVMAAHNDNGHEHLHIMVNLVDPENGKRFSLDKDTEKMRAWRIEYMTKHGTLHLMPQLEEQAKRMQAGERPDKGEKRKSRDQYERIDRAARDEIFARQSGERQGLYAIHNADWKQAKDESKDLKAAYKAAFTSALARAKAEDREKNKPAWRAIFREQKAEKARLASSADFLRQQVEQARKEARKATRAAQRAQRAGSSRLGRLAQRFGLVARPDAAANMKARAEQRLATIRAELARIEAKRAGLERQHESERRELSRVLNEAAFSKAKAAVAAMPRTDFAAMIERQNAERARLIDRHNIERAAVGLKPFEPKAKKPNAFAKAWERANQLEAEAKAQPAPIQAPEKPRDDYER